MPRLSLFNMAFGFLVIFFAACGGAFVSFDMTQAYLHDLSLLQTWQMDLMKSAHGHSNLFGLLHIAFGLSLPYSPLAQRWKKIQTVGLICGVLSMGPGMILRALRGPSESFDMIGILIAMGLSAALASLGSHAAALFLRSLRRQAF
ncbi:MAG: hypothetical protein NTX25_17995 [Proteobacteria bacterium]|nr:hypothetical protein [Pseudomonadota bacterium]